MDMANKDKKEENNRKISLIKKFRISLGIDKLQAKSIFKRLGVKTLNDLVN